LTTLLGNTNFASTTAAIPRKRGWMPVLTVLFLISYGIMTLLIVEQGTTIENQRALIRDLFHDSAELTALKGKAVHDRNQAGQKNSPKDSLDHDPGVQSPSSQTRSSQAAPQQRAQSHPKAQKPQVQAPSRPASDLNDDRRSLITI
jgi:hypothetical protein